MNAQIKKYAMTMFVAVIAVAAAFVTTAGEAAAYQSIDDYQHNHYTAYYKGGPSVCGLHICQPSENPNP